MTGGNELESLLDQKRRQTIDAEDEILSFRCLVP